MNSISKLFIILTVFISGTFVLIIGFIVFFFFVLLPSSMEQLEELNRKQSAETSGTIIWVDQYHSSGDPRDGGGMLNTTYSYQYIVDGVTHNQEQLGASSEGAKKNKGLKVKVCYDPSNPQSSSFHLSGNKTCGK